MGDEKMSVEEREQGERPRTLHCCVLEWFISGPIDPVLAYTCTCEVFVGVCL